MNDTSTKNLNKNNKREFKINSKFVISMFSILIGILIGMALMAIVGYNPVYLFESLIQGNFGNLQAFGNLLATTTWLAFLGLSMVVSFRANIFNIGISAQMVGGGLAGYLFAALVDSPNKLGMIGSILIPVAVGTLIALFIAFLKNKFKVNEVVSSIMINWSIYWVYRYFKNPINAPYLFDGGSTTINVAYENSLKMDWLTNLFDGSFINITIFILILVVPIIWFLYNKTIFGVKQDILGNNANVANYVGINKKAEVYKAMALSGALAGMAGASFYLGANDSLTYVSSDLAPEAFNGITIALIGFNSPIGAMFGAIFVGMFENSKTYLSVFATREIASLITAVIIWILAFSNYFILQKPQEKFFRWLNTDSPKYLEKKRREEGLSLEDENNKNKEIINKNSKDKDSEELKQKNKEKK